MEKGVVKEAYRGLMNYVMTLRTYFDKHYPDWFVSGSIYPGYMDMTYFSVVPATLKRRHLKVGIVFVHDTCRFEIWLAGSNRRVQAQYWTVFRESGWNRYRIPPTIKGVDSIVEYVVAEDPDFSDLDGLTALIEKGTATFIEDVEDFLSRHGPRLR